PGGVGVWRRQAVGVIVGIAGAPAVGRGRPGELPGAVVGVAGGHGLARCEGRGEIAAGVVAERPHVVAGGGGGGAARAGLGGQQAPVGGGVGGVQRPVLVGQRGLAALLVGDAGEVAVGVVGVVGVRGGVGLGDPGEHEVAVPGHRGGLVLGVGDRGRLAVAVVPVDGVVPERVGDRGLEGGRVVAVAGGLGGPVGERVDLPAQQAGGAGSVVGNGGLVAVGVAHAEQPGGLVGGARVRVGPVGRGGDRRAVPRRGGIGEHPAAVRQQGAGGGRAAALGDPQQVAVLVVVELHYVTAVVGDVLDVAADVGALSLVLAVVGDLDR